VKLVVAMDSFKGTLSANDACETVARGIHSVIPEAEVVLKPMADGGEGTAAAMIAARHGQWIRERVMGPLPGREVDAGYAWFDEPKEALVEMAAASGITLLQMDEFDPLRTTTYGTGQLIRSAVDHGARRIWLAVGGSATVDGGTGAAAAMGWRFLDADGKEVGLGGAALERIRRIVEPDGQSLLPLEVLCDVDNPLCGEHGAARVYGPQKGATPEVVERLEAGLKHLADVVSAQLGKNMLDVPGAGAAGGLAAGALAFMNGRLVPGIDAVIEASGFGEALKDADWVITGEGRFDEQSLRGKVVSGIVKAARKQETRVAVLAGSVAVGAEVYQKMGVATAIGAVKEGMSLQEALAQARPLLREAASELVRRHLR